MAKKLFGRGNPGKPKGAVHKTTKKAKEMVVELVEGNLPKAMEMLNRIEDPKDYLDTLAKFIGYVIPKKTDVTSDDQPLSPVIKVGYGKPNDRD